MTRFGYVMTTYFVTLWIGIFTLFHHSPRFIWNVSASVPTGLYALQPVQPLSVGNLVAVSLPPQLAALAATRHYLPTGLPLLKHIGALSGEIVCRHGLRVTIDNAAVASALAHDHAGRPLPVWQGCHTLKPGEIFLLNPAGADSFGVRYFGPLPVASSIGRIAAFWLARR